MLHLLFWLFQQLQRLFCPAVLSSCTAGEAGCARLTQTQQAPYKQWPAAQHRYQKHLGVSTSNSCLLPWWLQEQQQGLRGDGDAPADEHGQLCQHSVCGCIGGAQMAVLVWARECLKAGVGSCDAQGEIQQQNQGRVSSLGSHTAQVPPLRQGCSQQKLYLPGQHFVMNSFLVKVKE